MDAFQGPASPQDVLDVPMSTPETEDSSSKNDEFLSSKQDGREKDDLGAILLSALADSAQEVVIQVEFYDDFPSNMDLMH